MRKQGYSKVEQEDVPQKVGSMEEIPSSSSLFIHVSSEL